MDRAVDGIYSVELLFERPPTLEVGGLLPALSKWCPGIEPMGAPREQREVLAFAQTNHPVELKDATIPAQLVLFPAARPTDTVHIQDALQQSWAEREAASIVSRAPHRVLVTDLMARALPYKERADLFLRALAGLVQTLDPTAIHWRVSQQIRRPGPFLAAMESRRENVLFTGPLNVRFFNISDGAREGEMLMDTMGLAVLGLPDLQVHFHTLDPNEVVPFLYNLASYIFENGDVIESGHTVEGTRDGCKWRCQHEDAMVPPARLVLDVEAGEFAAGTRA